MKKSTNKMRALSVVLSLLMIFSVISFPTIKAKAAGTIDDFVERCYTVILNRPSEAEGFADWKNQLVTGQSVGAQVAYGFVFSKEYKNRNRTNKEYVTDLYKLFMDRDPDEGGFNDWVGKLEAGASREEVYVGFVNSQEFYNICDSYGITAGGFYLGYDRNQVNNVNLFVNRLYDTCLGRRGDRKGQQNWVNKLLKKEISGIECARSFIQSKEYINKNLSNEEYVENLYLAMMGRASDPEGKASWVNALANGTKTRDEVFAGFANSKEFGNICATYKIDKGSYAAKDVTKPESLQGEKRYRLAKTIFSNGDYSLFTYEDANVNVTERRFDKDGNFKAYAERVEHNADFTVWQYEHSYFDYDGNIIDQSFVKEVNNEDYTVRKEYIYSDEYQNLLWYNVWDIEHMTFIENGETVDEGLGKKVTQFYPDGSLMGYTLFTFDSKGRVIKQEEYYPSGKIKYVATSTFYDKNGRAEDRKEYVGISYEEDGTESWKGVIKYREDGQVTEELSYNHGLLDTRVVHLFDANGKETRAEDYNAEGVLLFYATMDYDSKGNVIQEVYYENDGSFFRKDTYEYNSNNQRTKESSYETWDGKTYETINKYDSNGNLIKITKTVDGVETYWEERQYEVY